MCALEIIRYQHKNSRFNLYKMLRGRNTSTMSDRTEVENTEEKEKGRGEGDEKDQINLLSFQQRSTQFIFPRLFALSLITGTFLFTYHDNSSRLLCGAHTHDGCHANGGSLEIDPTTGEKTGH